MGLSHELVSQFAKVVNDTKRQKSESIVYGTVRVDEHGNKYIQFDGSDQLTPVSEGNTPTIDTSAAMANENDRVSVLIKDHNAVVLGNMSSPSVGNGDIETSISNFDIAIGEQIQANRAYFKELIANNAELNKLSAAIISVVDLIAEEADIENLIAGKITVTDLIATKIDADLVVADQAIIDKLKANSATILSLIADNATIENLLANKATISSLIAEKLSAKEAEIKYANIDFANIGEAAIEKLFSDSGIIKDLIMSEGHVTGKLVGVTIVGDLIEGGTVVADKLVVLGEDGLYYKLNVDAETVSGEQTDYNSLNGKIITAKSVTAEKIRVDDLVAFDATIGGFNITENSIYSGVKESADNTTRGIYLDNDGQIAFGDSNNYLKFFKDADGEYKLEISASSMIFASGDTTVEKEIEDIKNANDNAIKTIVVQYALSDYTSTAPTSGWSEVAPEWTVGKYMWQRVVRTYNNGTVVEGDPTCIAGAKGEDGTTYYIHIKYSNDGGKTFTSNNGEDVGEYMGTYVDQTLTDSSDVTLYKWAKIKGEQGIQGEDGTSVTIKGSYNNILELESEHPTGELGDAYIVEGRLYVWNGSKWEDVGLIQGPQGVTGTGVTSITAQYYVSTSKTEQIGGEWQETMPTWEIDTYLWIRNKIVYKDPESTVYTEPYCDSSWEAINEIELGGRNLLTGTKNFSGFYSNRNTTEIIEGDDGYTYVNFPVVDELDYRAISSTYSMLDIKDIIDREVVLSFEFRADNAWTAANTDILLGFALCNDESTTRIRYNTTYFTGNITTEWKRHNVAVKLNEDFFSNGDGSIGDCTRFYVQVYAHTLNQLQVRKIKMEYGTIGTDWTPAPEDVDQSIADTNTELREVIRESHTTIVKDCESIILGALESYTESDDFESFKKVTESQLKILSDEMTIQFEQTTSRLTETNNSLQEQLNTITKYFTFDINGMTIGQVDSPNKVVIDNDEISILVNGNVVQQFDATGKATVPELHVTRTANLVGLLLQETEDTIDFTYVAPTTT